MVGVCDPPPKKNTLDDFGWFSYFRNFGMGNLKRHLSNAKTLDCLVYSETAVFQIPCE